MRWLLLALVLLGCTRKDAPPRPDSLPPDTVQVDSLPEETDTTGGSVPTATPEDTLEGLDLSLFQRASFTAATGMQSSAGIVLGISGWRDWCSAPFTGAPVGAPPNLAGGLLRAAHRCGARLAVVFPKVYLTVGGRPTGAFCSSCFKRFVDDLARALPPDTLRKYTENGTLLYFSTLDDMTSAEKWGGHTIPGSVVADHACYAAEKLGAAPIGLRLSAREMAQLYSNWRGCVEVSVAQWHKRKERGNQQLWYDKARSAMIGVGVQRQIYSVNTHHCIGQDSDPCTPDEVRRFVSLALRYPQSYGYIGWKMDDYTLRGGYRDVWYDMAALARSLPTTRF